jgi:hypothetical protein
MCFCCFGGIILAFFTTILYRLVLATIDEKDTALAQDESYKNTLSTKVFTALGLADFLTGFVVARFTLTHTPARLAQIHCTIGLLTLALCFLQYALSSYLLCFPIAMLWG